VDRPRQPAAASWRCQLHGGERGAAPQHARCISLFRPALGALDSVHNGSGVRCARRFRWLHCANAHLLEDRWPPTASRPVVLVAIMMADLGRCRGHWFRVSAQRKRRP